MDKSFEGVAFKRVDCAEWCILLAQYTCYATEVRNSMLGLNLMVHRLSINHPTHHKVPIAIVDYNTPKTYYITEDPKFAIQHDIPEE